MKKNRFRILFILPLFIILFSDCENPLNTTKVEKVETKYEVHHRREKVDGTFDKEEDEVEIKNGFVGEMTVARPLTTSRYDGFDPQYYQQKVIRKEQTIKDEEDNDIIVRTTVIIEYYRKKYTYTFKDNNEIIKEIKGKYEQQVPRREIPTPEREDAFFERWEPSTIPESFSSNMTFTAVWRSADADYTVQHKIQNINDNNYTFKEDEVKTAPANRRTTAEPKNYPGFTAKLPITQKYIDPDGSTVVTIFYDRNIYTFSFNTNGGNTIESIQGKYGAALPAVQTPVKQGYTFSRWNPELPQTFNTTSNKEYSAVWLPATNTQYKVEYYLQNLNLNDYVKDSDNTFTGTTDSTPSITPPPYEGFTVKEFTPVIIKPDGSTVIKLYYDRNLCSVVLKSNGEIIRTLSGRYGTDFPVIATPSRSGYTFTAWEPALPETYTSSAEHIAQWTPKNNTQYKVECYLQNANGSGYSRRSSYTQTLTGTTGELTEAVPLELPGYVARMDFEQLPIAGDGSTVIIIYYDIAN